MTQFTNCFTGLQRDFGFCNIARGYKDPQTGKIKFNSGDYGWAGKPITQKDYEGKIYIADFFFTSCKSICIPMAYNMSELQEYYKNDDTVLFLSHSVTPKIDSVSV